MTTSTEIITAREALTRVGLPALALAYGRGQDAIRHPNAAALIETADAARQHVGRPMMTERDVTRMVSATFGGYVEVSSHRTPGVCMLGEPTRRRSALVSTLTRMEAAGRIKINRDKRKRMHSISFVTWIPMIPRRVRGSR